MTLLAVKPAIVTRCSGSAYNQAAWLTARRLTFSPALHVSSSPVVYREYVIQERKARAFSRLLHL